MALTLVEAAKLETGDVVRQAIIELYAGSSDILMNLPFETIAGNAMKYNRESSLPGVGFRGVNEAYTPSTGVLNPLTEALVIAGGDLDVVPLVEDRIDLGALLQENVLLSLPVQPVCREGCRGLCPRCGAPLNAGPCGCPPQRVDPRLQALAKLRPTRPENA
jgi:hypothetical protein